MFTLYQEFPFKLFYRFHSNSGNLQEKTFRIALAWTSLEAAQLAEKHILSQDPDKRLSEIRTRLTAMHIGCFPALARQTVAK